MRTAAENAALGALLAHRENAKLICWTLLRNGWPRQDVQDGLQDVYVKALESFRRKPPPDTLERMMALCSVIAKNHAISAKREAASRRADLAAPCTRAEYGVVEREPVRRDAVDAEKQLEVLAGLFRDGKMPPQGVDILEGFSSGCSYAEIGESLGISADTAEWRLREMKEIYRRRLAKLGLLPNRAPLRLVIPQPGAITSLRRVA
jgi:DNA-directed RNA polymerase specialized sigma24 family protein